MPHIIVEYTDDLKRTATFEEIFAQVHGVLAEVAGIRSGNCKSRAVSHTDFRVGDGTPKEGFVHVSLRFLEGRSATVKQEIGHRILEILRNSFKQTLSSAPLQITVEIRDIRPSDYFKFPEGTI